MKTTKKLLMVILKRKFVEHLEKRKGRWDRLVMNEEDSFEGD